MVAAGRRAGSTQGRQVLMGSSVFAAHRASGGGNAFTPDSFLRWATSAAETLDSVLRAVRASAPRRVRDASSEEAVLFILL